MMLRPCFRSAGRAVRIQRRYRHTMPTLGNGVGNESGVPGLFSPPGFQMGWSKYQSFLLDKLNQFTDGTDFQNKNIKDTLVQTARNPDTAALFNYASMAHNNHFFYSSLSPAKVPIPASLEKELVASFSSIDTLRQEIVATAASMFGPGYVWIVMNNRRKFSIMTTYQAGTPYAEAHYRQQPVDMNTEDKSVSEAVKRMNRMPISNTAGTHGVLSQSQNLAPGGAVYRPVLCVNTWEHVYLMDYGAAWISRLGADGEEEVVEGKRQYIENWWNAIDWSVVQSRTEENRGLLRR